MHCCSGTRRGYAKPIPRRHLTLNSAARRSFFVFSSKANARRATRTELIIHATIAIFAETILLDVCFALFCNSSSALWLSRLNMRGNGRKIAKISTGNYVRYFSLSLERRKRECSSPFYRVNVEKEDVNGKERKAKVATTVETSPPTILNQHPGI